MFLKVTLISSVKEGRCATNTMTKVLYQQWNLVASHIENGHKSRDKDIRYRD